MEKDMKPMTFEDINDDKQKEALEEAKTEPIPTLQQHLRMPPTPVPLRNFHVRDLSENRQYAVKVGETIRLENGEPVVIVRAELLSRLLVYLTKFKGKIQNTPTNGSSRFMDPEDFAMSINLRGFTPEDFNALMSLTMSITDGLEFLKDVQTPQMARPMKDRERMAQMGARPPLKPEEKLFIEQMAKPPPPINVAVVAAAIATHKDGDDDGQQ